MDFLRSTLDESGHLIKAFNDDFFDDIKHKRALVSKILCLLFPFLSTLPAYRLSMSHDVLLHQTLLIGVMFALFSRLSSCLSLPHVKACTSLIELGDQSL